MAMRLKTFWKRFIIVSFLLLIFAQQVYSAEIGKNKIYTGIFGLWAWGDWDDALKIVKNNGFDIAIGVSNKKVLDRAHELGLKCIVDYGLKKEEAQDETKWQKYLEGLRTKVTELKDHPAVFAWYIVDEPDWQKIPVEKIKIATDLVRSIDKTKPLFTVLTIKDRWHEYLPYFDIISIDPYLKVKRDGTSETPEKVREWIIKMRSDMKTANLKKPLWVVLGAFEEKPRIPLLHKSPFKKPTPDEFNEMVNIALSEKVDGVFAWTLSFRDFPRYKDWRLPEDDPALWEAVRNIPNAVRSHKK